MPATAGCKHAPSAAPFGASRLQRRLGRRIEAHSRSVVVLLPQPRTKVGRCVVARRRTEARLVGDNPAVELSQREASTARSRTRRAASARGVSHTPAERAGGPVHAKQRGGASQRGASQRGSCGRASYGGRALDAAERYRRTTRQRLRRLEESRVHQHLSRGVEATALVPQRACTDAAGEG